MALTRPKLSHNIDTDSSVFTDPILVLHQSATAANVDSGFLFNRANGLVSNVAIYWSESANSFVTAFSTSAGSTNSNIAVSTYANLRTGILTSNSITNSGTLVIGNTGDVSANIGSFYTYANTTFATVSGTSSGIDANLGAFQTYANTKIGTNNNGNLVVAALTQSTSTTTGALVVGGGAAVGGNLYVGGNLIVSNVVYQNSEIITTTELVQGNMIAASSAVSTSTTTGALVVIGGAGIGGALYITNTGDVSANIGAYQTYANANVTAIQANLGAYQTYANANVVALQANLGAYQTYANANVVAIQANLGAYQTYANANIATIQANIGAYQTYANANVVAIQANLGAYQTFANSNAATQATSIDTINANIGAYQTYANANVVAIQANLGAYQTYANANVVAIQANLGAFQVFSNANAATQAISINSIVTNANANTAAYLLTATGNINAGNITTSGTSGNISGVNYIFASNYVYANGVSIFSGTYSNTNVEAYIGGNIGAFQIFSNANAATQATSINTINANIGAYQTYANANLGTATTNITTLFSNAASQEISITSLATGANANTAAYLPSVTTLAGLTSFGATNTTTTAQGNLIVVGNLTVQGNTLTIGSNNLTVTDSIIDLHTFANLDPLISNDGRDIGIRFHYYKTSDKHAFLGWENATETLTYYQDATETNGTVTGTLGNVELGSLYISNTATSTSATTGALVVGGGVGITGNVYADKFYTTNGLYWAGNGLAFSSGLTISEIDSANALSNISNSVTSIRFDRDTGFSVVELDPGNVKVSLGSSFKTWHVPGQADLVAVAEDEVTFFGNSIDITTNPTAPKSITFATNLAAYTGNITAGNITSSGNIRTDKLYTTNGVYWSGNGAAYAGGGSGFSVVNVLSSNELTANAEGVSKLTLIGIDGISITSNSATDTITFSATTTASIWGSDHDSGLVTDAHVVLSEDNGLVTDVAVSEYDLGTITITGVLTGDTIAVNSIPGNRLITGTDISVGNISAAGNLSFTGTTKRIVADFTSSPVSQRLLFQTNTASGATNVYAIPNGAGTTAAFSVANNSDPDNASIGQLAQLSTELRIQNVITGTGTYLPMTFYTGGSERVKIDATSGNVVITPTTTSTTATTGALVVRGGIGVAGNINIDQLATITGNVIMSSNVTISRSLGVGTAVAGNVGEIRATNYITAFYSDKRLKSNIEPITSALDKVKHLAGVLYTQNTLAEQYGYNDYGQQVGLFAQDVQQVLPQAVKPAPFDIGPNGTSISGQNYLTIQYEKMVPLLVEAIKELSDIVDQLKEH